jgi:Meiotically up-regulated gene 113
VDKQHILEEIRRTATANGGNPLGRLRFLTETGIKQSDWYGKYWIRWGDALVEAGLAPNSKQQPYEEGHLIVKLISLTREIGPFPIAGDLRMKARKDPDFPSHTSFNRLGLKNQRMLRVAEYCRTNKGFEDILELCQDVADRKQQSHEKEAGTEDIGFVYLIKSGRYYKIGRSNSSGRREYELAIQLPERANKVHEIRTDDPIGIEAYWHNRFEAKRKNGEWFDLTPLDVKAFRRRKFM